MQQPPPCGDEATQPVPADCGTAVEVEEPPCKRSRSIELSQSAFMMTQVLQTSIRHAVSSDIGAGPMTRSLNASAEANFRHAYEELISLPDAREQLTRVAEALQADVVESRSTTIGGLAASMQPWRLHVAASSVQLFGFDGQQRVVTIGRAPFNDVSLPRAVTAVSRVHVVVFNVGLFLVLCDVGSRNGFGIVSRSSAPAGRGDADWSRTGQRRPLMVDLNETVVVSLGGCLRVTINPKDCVVCLARPREGVFDCGHFVCCRHCAGELPLSMHVCPVCRAPIHMFQSAQCAATKAA